nr:transposase [Paraburkholderia sp. BL27I4N3]
MPRGGRAHRSRCGQPFLLKTVISSCAIAATHAAPPTQRLGVRSWISSRVVSICHRNGTSRKTIITPNGELNLDIPCDRQATFEPQLVGKYQRQLPGFDDHVISMYARGMSMREIQGHLLELYGLQVSPDLISTVTDEVLAEVEQWQQRPLEAMYPIVYFDALRLKIRDEGTVRNKAVYLALGIRADGARKCWVCGSSKPRGPSSG